MGFGTVNENDITDLIEYHDLNELWNSIFNDSQRSFILDKYCDLEYETLNSKTTSYEESKLGLIKKFLGYCENTAKLDIVYDIYDYFEYNMKHTTEVVELEGFYKKVYDVILSIYIKLFKDKIGGKLTIKLADDIEYSILDTFIRCCENIIKTSREAYEYKTSSDKYDKSNEYYLLSLENTMQYYGYGGLIQVYLIKKECDKAQDIYHKAINEGYNFEYLKNIINHEMLKNEVEKKIFLSIEELKKYGEEIHMINTIDDDFDLVNNHMKIDIDEDIEFQKIMEKIIRYNYLIAFYSQYIDKLDGVKDLIKEVSRSQIDSYNNMCDIVVNGRKFFSIIDEKRIYIQLCPIYFVRDKYESIYRKDIFKYTLICLKPIEESLLGYNALYNIYTTYENDYNAAINLLNEAEEYGLGDFRVDKNKLEIKRKLHKLKNMFFRK